MPKIAANGNPSYAGHEGLVVNARDNVYEVNPSRDIEGNRPDGYVNEPVEEVDEVPAPGLGGPITPVDPDEDAKRDEQESADDADEDGKDEDKRGSEEWDPAKPKPGNQTPAFQPRQADTDETDGNTTIPTTDDTSGVQTPKKNTPAKSTNAAKK